MLNLGVVTISCYFLLSYLHVLFVNIGQQSLSVDLCFITKLASVPQHQYLHHCVRTHTNATA